MNSGKETKQLSIPKPILKWIGGKTQILDKLLKEFPSEMDNYHEIFLGGGSVLLGILTLAKNKTIKINKNIYAYDLNEPLIYMYKNIQKQPDDVYTNIENIIREFNDCGNGLVNRKPKNIEEAKETKENYYYWIRKRYNELKDKKSCLGSAMFIFLNKTCFRGVFRMGPNGFNVPYGHYKNPEIINKEHLMQIHNLISNVIFECKDFRDSLINIEKNDFVYLDPPYVPEKYNSFVSYTNVGFDLETHKLLFIMIHNLTKNGQKIVLCNSDVSLVRNSFDDKYNIFHILCKRTINCKNPNSKTTELVIKNY